MKSLLVFILCLPLLINAQVENNIPKDIFAIEYDLGSSNQSGIHLNYEKWLTSKDAIRVGISGNISYSSRQTYESKGWRYNLGVNIGYRRVIFEKNNVQLLTGLDVGFIKYKNPFKYFSYDNEIFATIPLELRIKLNDKISFSTSLGVRISNTIDDNQFRVRLKPKMGILIRL